MAKRELVGVFPELPSFLAANVPFSFNTLLFSFGIGVGAEKKAPTTKRGVTE